MVTKISSIDTRCPDWVSFSSKDPHRRVVFRAAGVLVLMMVAATTPSVLVQADTFNYRSTRGDDYGPDDWKKVQCKDLETCVSFFFGFILRYQSYDTCAGCD